MTSDDPTSRPFLTVKQVADTLSVNRNTVYAWIGRGELDCIRLPGGGALRIPQSAFEQFIDKISRSVRETDAPCSHSKVAQWGGRFFEKGQKVKRITQQDSSVSG
jgi:excisionase family DNA binding protein